MEVEPATTGNGGESHSSSTSISGGDEASGDATASSPPDCATRIEIGEFEVVAAAAFDEMQHYDVDGDGVDDIYGEFGNLLYVHKDGLEADQLPVTYWNTFVGQFNGMPGVDVLEVTGEGVRVFASLDLAGPAVDTEIPIVSVVESGDVNADEIDDLLLTRTESPSLQVWLGSEEGAFEWSSEIDVGAGTLVRVEPPRVDIVAYSNADGGRLEHYLGDASGSFVQSDFTWGPIGANIVAIPMAAGDYVATGWHDGRTLLEGAAIVEFPEQASPLAWAYHFESSALDFMSMGSGWLTGADIDDDGFPELFVRQIDEADSTSQRIEAACRTGEGLVTCGGAWLPHFGGTVTIVGSPGARWLVHSADEFDTTYAATVSVSGCP